MNREDWLNRFKDLLKPRFEDRGHKIPENLRIACGWPSKGATSCTRKTLGQCFCPSTSSDNTHEIFISPVLADPLEVSAVLIHEIIHAVVGVKEGHKGAFKRLAVDLGLEGKMTATHAGERLNVTLGLMSDKLGPYPHAEISLKSIKKQGTRMIKLECPACGYVVRTTRKWVETGVPTCTPCGEDFVLKV